MCRQRPSRHRQRGFTYLMLLWWVAISGVMLMALSQRWVMESRRQREAELVFRGEQIRLALEAYAKVPVREGLSPYPQKLEDLLSDSRGGKTVRHLRQVWRDPITNQRTWGLLKDKGGIRGVYSLSTQAPVTAPASVRRYDEWRFEVQAAPAPALPTQGASAP